MSVELESDANLEEIYTWIEQIPFSKPKKNLARDFSDGGTKRKCYFTKQFCSFLHNDV